MPGPAILRGAAALLLSLATISAASADYRAGDGGPFGAPAARMHAGPHRAGAMRPALHHRRHGNHDGSYRRGYGHRGVYGPRHHAERAFFHRGHYGFRHGPRFAGPAYGHVPGRRLFRAHGHRLGGYGRPAYGYGYGGYGGYGATYAGPVYGESYGTYPTLAYGTVAGAAPYGALYNRPAGPPCY
jgi:hypothetical protein